MNHYVPVRLAIMAYWPMLLCNAWVSSQTLKFHFRHFGDHLVAAVNIPGKVGGVVIPVKMLPWVSKGIEC